MKSQKENLIFIVEDNEIFAGMLKFRLSQIGYDNVKVFYNGKECMEHLYMNPGLVLLDYKLQDISGLDILKEIKSINPDMQVIILSSQETIQVAIDTMKYGAFDYLIKNDNVFDKLEITLRKVFKINELIHKTRKFKELKKSFLTTLTLLITMMLMLGTGVI